LLIENIGLSVLTWLMVRVIFTAL